MSEKLDPRKVHKHMKHVPMSYVDSVAALCEFCGGVRQQDRWSAILGFNAGVQLPFGKKSTLGKLGKRTRLSICRDCHLVSEA